MSLALKYIRKDVSECDSHRLGPKIRYGGSRDEHLGGKDFEAERPRSGAHGTGSFADLDHLQLELNQMRGKTIQKSRLQGEKEERQGRRI